jgi:chorismate synthase
MLRFMTAGESHGQALLTIVEGVPAGLALRADYVNEQLARRQRGYGRGGRMRIETDQVELLAGVRAGRTIGSPIGLLIRNRDWENWRQVMDPSPEQAGRRAREVFVPRPGHADLAGAAKFGAADMRDVLERASARETAARVAAGAVARRLLEELGINIFSHVIAIGGVSAEIEGLKPSDMQRRSERSELRCADGSAEKRMRAAIDDARERGDTLGGIFQVVAESVPPGLGSYIQWDRRLDGRLAQAVMSIPAVKGVEIGAGFASAGLPGSEAHDEILRGSARSRLPWKRATNRAGGMEGGVTNGEAVVIQAAMKPLSTLMKPLRSMDVRTGRAARAHVERSDICAVPAAAVVGEALVALELASAALEKFGGDSMAEFLRNHKGYLQQVYRQFRWSAKR